METTSPANSNAVSALAAIEELPERLDDAMLARCEAYANAPLPALPLTDKRHLTEFMAVMADMPRQKVDGMVASLKMDNMERHLGHLPREAVNWMASVAHARFKFYPTIKELLDLSQEWTRNDAALRGRMLAKRRAREEMNKRLDEARMWLRWFRCDQGWIDGLSERMKAILETNSLLTQCECGSYAQRPQWRRALELETGKDDQ